MIEKNVPLQFDAEGQLYAKVVDPELNDMLDKWDGQVSVRVAKPIQKGTNQQNRLAHGLMTAFFLSGMHSAPNPPEGMKPSDPKYANYVYDPDSFKQWLKFQIGITHEWSFEGRDCVVAKSWARYTKAERMEFITRLISMVMQSGAATEDKNIQEILQGLEDNQKITG